MIAASRNEKIPQLDIRRKVREKLAREGMPSQEGFLEYFGSLCSLKPLKYAFLGLLLVSISGYAAVTSSTDQSNNTSTDPVASFLIDSNYSVSNES